MKVMKNHVQSYTPKLITMFSNISEKIMCNKVTSYTTIFYQINHLDSKFALGKEGLNHFSRIKLMCLTNKSMLRSLSKTIGLITNYSY